VNPRRCHDPAKGARAEKARAEKARAEKARAEKARAEKAPLGSFDILGDSIVDFGIVMGLCRGKFGFPSQPWCLGVPPFIILDAAAGQSFFSAQFFDSPPDPSAKVFSMDQPWPVKTEDGSYTLFHPAYAQSYRSARGASNESRHVFLESSGVAARLAAGLTTHIAEIGFGTGRNFILTAALASRSNAVVHYVAFERQLLAAPLLRLAHASDGADETCDAGYQQVLDSLLQWRSSLADPLPADAVWRHESVTLTLRLGEATARVLHEPRGVFDAVYLDPFSPAANPELWSPSFLAAVCPMLRSGGTLVSYSVKGEVRRTLTALGLIVSRVDGPVGAKRHSLRAIVPSPTASATNTA
jgi:tRNA U34 5-methylaminomethyl-2-thiouridine-forming methyltransferase MnmC